MGVPADNPQVAELRLERDEARKALARIANSPTRASASYECEELRHIARAALGAGLSTGAEGAAGGGPMTSAFRHDLAALVSLAAELEAAEGKYAYLRDQYHEQRGLRDQAEAERDEARKALRECRELFVELRGDWSDNRGPCREGFRIIDAALGAGLSTGAEEQRK